MCDTLLYRHPNYTLFAKNSDREPNEAQAVVFQPAKSHANQLLNCSYIEFPQVENTYAVLLCKPFQMWGAEMGVNEYGVTIGNEAVFTKVKERKENTGLTGMDMIRLALERTSSSQQALQYIISLVETYGQDACGGYHDKDFYYHNSFIIADTNEGYKLETAGQHWAYSRILQSDSISNGLTIDDDYDQISTNAKSYAAKKGWYDSTESFSFRKSYSAKLYTALTKSNYRRHQTLQCQNAELEYDIPQAMKALQMHENHTCFEAHKASAKCVCMHPTGFFNPSQTNGSLIVKLRKGQEPKIWLTATSMPCLSIFKPWRFSHPVDVGDLPSARYDNSLWWRAEKINRLICYDYQKYYPFHQDIFRDFQDSIISSHKDDNNQSVWDQYSEKLKKLESLIDRQRIKLKSKNLFYRHFINKRDKVLK